ncbi:hypothetical protein F4821DRAFT_253505 [Hypoxylon rubiginosum]|uniref:Uncharacterized protein n=1 Tax=Hypoxylon rubiginosum TaxID=110542 RepID=A0ACC0DKN0_9PEZI|nr:hypothetical protein F4821DRAFT_253505 [Hypoxylon rubiginosum]
MVPREEAQTCQVPHGPTRESRSRSPPEVTMTKQVRCASPWRASMVPFALQLKPPPPSALGTEPPAPRALDDRDFMTNRGDGKARRLSIRREAKLSTRSRPGSVWSWPCTSGSSWPRTSTPRATSPSCGTLQVVAPRSGARKSRLLRTQKPPTPSFRRPRLPPKLGCNGHPSQTPPRAGQDDEEWRRDEAEMRQLIPKPPYDLTGLVDPALEHATKLSTKAKQPSAVVVVKGRIALNEGRKRIRLAVTGTGDRPIQVGSHYHSVETNPLLEFDRGAAYGYRLDISAGTSVRFEPGDSKTVTLVEIGGNRVIRGGNKMASGQVDLLRAEAIVNALQQAGSRGSHYHFVETNPQLEFDRGPSHRGRHQRAPSLLLLLIGVGPLRSTGNGEGSSQNPMANSIPHVTTNPALRAHILFLPPSACRTTSSMLFVSLLLLKHPLYFYLVFAMQQEDRESSVPAQGNGAETPADNSTGAGTGVASYASHPIDMPTAWYNNESEVPWRVYPSAPDRRDIHICPSR